MIKFLAFSLIFLFVGCNQADPRFVGKYVKSNTEVFSVNNKISISIPTSYSKVLWDSWSDFRKDRITLDRTIPNRMRQDINIRIEHLDLNFLSNYKLLQKESNKTYEEYISNLPLSSWKIRNHHQKRVNYYKKYVDYIAGLKCVTSVDSQNIAAGIGSKRYQSSCNYYDKQGLPKLLYIDYQFYFTFAGTRFEQSNNPSSLKYKFEEIQLQFKKDMKEIFDSMNIYDMDREKMHKEGLLYDKKYILDSESIVKDKSIKCTMIRKDDKVYHWICTGRESNLKLKCINNKEKSDWICKEKK